MTQQTTPRKRIVFYVEVTMTDGNGNYVPAIVTEDEPGYTPATYHWGNDLAIAKQAAKDANARLGIDHDTAMDIIASSMAASRAAGLL